MAKKIDVEISYRAEESYHNMIELKIRLQRPLDGEEYKAIQNVIDTLDALAQAHIPEESLTEKKEEE